MTDNFTTEERELVDNLRTGGLEAWSQFFNEKRQELEYLTRFRVNRLLKRRLDEADVLQEAYLEYCRRIATYLEDPIIPPTVWLRRLVRQVISHQNRHHLGAQCRDLRREKIERLSCTVDIKQLAHSLSSVGSRLGRIELRERLLALVEAMSPLEREIITLIHFEERSIREAAMELEIGIEAAKKRYQRALNRLRSLHKKELAVFNDRY